MCNLHCSPISCCRECTGSSRRGKRDLELAAPEKRLLQNSNSNFRQSLPLIPTTELGAMPSWQPAHLVPYLRKKSSRQNTSLEWVNMIMVIGCDFENTCSWQSTSPWGVARKRRSWDIWRATAGQPPENKVILSLWDLIKDKNFPCLEDESVKYEPPAGSTFGDRCWKKGFVNRFLRELR